MQKIIRILSREYGNLNEAAILLGIFAFLSQVLALFRDRSIAHFIGPTSTLDTYYAAFRVPDMIFISVASLVSITVLIPFFMDKMKDGKTTIEARKFLDDIFTVFFSAIALIALIAFFLMPHLVSFIAPGFDSAMQDKVVSLSRIMLLSPILLGLSNMFGTVTQLFRQFFVYALSPILYNLGIIAGVVFLYPIFGIHGLAFGVVFGALMHFALQLFSAFNSGFTPRFSASINFREIKRVVFVSLPRTFGLACNNLSIIFIVALASYLESGSISVFNFSFNLQSVPLNIIGISYAVAAFPTLAKSISLGKREEFKNNLKRAARSIVFWSIPVIFLFIVLRAQIVRVILGSGSFSWDNTRLVAASLAIFSISVLAQGMIALLSRTYYATGDTRTPLGVNLLSSVLIVVLSYCLLYVFENFLFFRYFIESMLKVTDIPGTEVLMLPLAYSLGTIFNAALHWFFVRKDFMGGESFITKTFFQSLGGAFFTGAVAYLSLNIFSPIFGTTTFWGIFLQGFLSGVFGIACGMLILHLLGSEEFREIAKTLKTRFWRARIIAPPQEEL